MPARVMMPSNAQVCRKSQVERFFLQTKEWFRSPDCDLRRLPPISAPDNQSVSVRNLLLPRPDKNLHSISAIATTASPAHPRAQVRRARSMT